MSTRTRAPREVAADPMAETLDRYLLTGDEAAMEAVVRATRERLVAAARRIGDPADAEDAVQGAYLSLVRRRGARLEAPVLPWLLTATIRIAYRKKALARRDRDIADRLARPPAAPSPVDAAAGAEEAARLWRDVEALPERYRDPLVLHHLQGVSTPEVARLLDIPEATVRTRLRRGRTLLRWHWSPRWTHAALLLPWSVGDLFRGEVAGSPGGAMLPAAGLAALAALGGFAVGAATAHGPDAAGRAVPDGGVPAIAADDGVRAARAEAARLGAAARAAEEARAHLDAEAAALRRRLADAGAALEIGAAASAPDGPRAVRGAAPGRIHALLGGPTLEGQDWDAVAESFRRLPALLARIVDAAASGEEMPPETVGDVQRWNGPLVTAALSLGEEVPGSTANERFTHPWFLCRAIEGALAAAGLPLDDAQVAAMARLAREHAEARRPTPSAEGGPASRALREFRTVAADREAWIEASLALLRPDQREILRPASVRGRVGVDILSSGLLWAERMIEHVVRPSSRAELAAHVTDLLLRRLRIAADRRDDVHAAAATWVAALPAAWSDPRATLPPFGSPLLADLVDLASRWEELVDEVARRFPATATERDGGFPPIPLPNVPLR